MEPIYVKQAQINDLPAIMAIIEQAQQQMHQDNNPQWQNNYPNTTDLETDIHRKQCYVLIANQKVVGTATLIVGIEPHYQRIYAGSWQENQQPYATIHRIAIDSRQTGKHLGKIFISNLLSLAVAQSVHNFRIDTHPINKRMQGLIKSMGYQYRGQIYVGSGNDDIRWAYELNL